MSEPAPPGAAATAADAPEAEEVARLLASLGAAREPIGARVADLAYASLFGAGVLAWTAAMLVGLQHADLPSFFDSEHATVVAASAVGWAVGLFLGFRTPIRSYASLARRGVGLIVIGAPAAALLTITTFLARQPAKGFDLLACAGLALAAFVAARRGLVSVASPRRRRVAGAALSALAVVTLVVQSDRLRCLVGQGRACGAAGDAQDGDAASAAEWASRGCARGDARSCRVAGQAFYEGRGVDRGHREAERMFRKACALGSSCDELETLDAERGCAEHHAFACADLARRLTMSDPGGARRARAKACLLGLDEACAP